MDNIRVNEILEEYINSDLEDYDVRTEIIDRVAGLSDDPEVKVLIGEIDSDKDAKSLDKVGMKGFSVEVFENGNWFEFLVLGETIDWDNEGSDYD